MISADQPERDSTEVFRKLPLKVPKNVLAKVPERLTEKVEDSGDTIEDSC